jgi:uncharacterized protein (DUF2141 family)
VDRRTRRLFAAALAVVVVLAAAAAVLGGRTIPVGDAQPGQGPQAVGVVVRIDTSGLARVRSFTLRTDDGRVLTFQIGDLENGQQFPPGHLAEHQATAQKVRVWYRAEGGDLVAYRLEDVP